MKEKIVIALGRSALGDDFPKQQAGVAVSARAIADLIEARYHVIITHSNGPQVGMIHTAMTELNHNHPDLYSPAPMSVCTALSQGYIGYDLQNALRTELLNRGIFKTVVTLITQVRVDPFDPAFSHPVKTLGRYMSEEDAQAEEAKGNYVIKEEQGYQRIYCSPKPLEIYEIDAIRTLEEAGQVVIACGGGGIPVLEQGTRLKGASAVIEKDFTAASWPSAMALPRRPTWMSSPSRKLRNIWMREDSPPPPPSPSWRLPSTLWPPPPDGERSSAVWMRPWMP